MVVLLMERNTGYIGQLGCRKGIELAYLGALSVARMDKGREIGARISERIKPKCVAMVAETKGHNATCPYLTMDLSVLIFSDHQLGQMGTTFHCLDIFYHLLHTTTIVIHQYPSQAHNRISVF